MNDKLKKYLLYFVNLALFVALVIYSIKYGPVLIKNLGEAKVSWLIVVFVVQIIILILLAFKWMILLKKFNKKRLSFKDIFLVYNGSNIYKYVPPKGINYIMRYNLAKKTDLKGKVTTMFGEFYAELFIGAIAAMVFLLFFFPFNILLVTLVIIAISLLILGMFKPGISMFILNLFRLRVPRVRKLIGYFSDLTKSKQYIFNLVLALGIAILHGVAFYSLNLAFDFKNLTVLTATLTFYSAHFISFITFAPAGLGIRDLSIVGILKLMGYSNPNAIMISLMYRVIMFISELVVGLISLVLLKRES